ncbi:MAG TPA: MFS transporter [Anaeromyxobacteraceae bacterium]|nr:MFS transporter [Anaeromyxobacteraceae bacterium]
MSPAARLRLFYFAYYGGVGTLLPFFAPYLRGLGFSGEQIGTVQMIGPLLAVPVALSWATAADRLRAPARVLSLATAWAFAAVLFLPAARTPLGVGLVLLGYSLADRAVVPLVDSLTVEWTIHHPETSYARIRLFGSLGFAVVTTAVGLALTLRGDRPGDPLVPLAVAACVGGYALAARRLPAPPAPPHPPRFREMAGLLRDGPLLAMLAVLSIHWGATAPFHLLFGLFVRDLGLPATVTGAGMSLGVAAEVVALLAFPRVAALFSLRAILAVAFAVSAARWALLSQARSAVAVVGLQALHAFTFGLFWGAAMDAMSRAVPSRMRATGQAIFGAVVFGVGNAVGYQLSGLGYDRWHGVGPLFAWAAAAELGALVLLLLLPVPFLSGDRAASSRR